jgi:hypothetical protein
MDLHLGTNIFEEHANSIFIPEDAISMFLWNVDTSLHGVTAPKTTMVIFTT